MLRLDNKDRYTLFGVYEVCEGDINSDLKKLKYKKGEIRKINYKFFRKVIRLYFTILFKELIKGKSVRLYNRFGILNIVKTQCTRYNPKKYIMRFNEETEEYERKLVQIKLDFGYFHFVFWDSPKVLRPYKFNINNKWKRLFMDKVNDGFEYLDLSLFKYGRNASPDYIHHIK